LEAALSENNKLHDVATLVVVQTPQRFLSDEFGSYYGCIAPAYELR
jgi:hypothetical protein